MGKQSSPQFGQRIKFAKEVGLKKIISAVGVLCLLVIPSVFGGELESQGTAAALAPGGPDQTVVLGTQPYEGYPWDADQAICPDSLSACPDDTGSPMEQSGTREALLPSGVRMSEFPVVHHEMIDMVVMVLRVVWH